MTLSDGGVMEFYADLHIHSKYSRATSRDCDLEHFSVWAQKKGIQVIGTGDFTHPAWLSELEQKLLPAEPGLFRLRADLTDEPRYALPGRCRSEPRFMLSAEISTIYKKGDQTRKVHHCVYAPDFESVRRIVNRLDRIGNIRSDGRPILGLDSRDLFEIVLEAGKDCALIPAHVWTPWFSVLGSKSGFDDIESCYEDLSPHIFALETGLSSDPPMNWRVSGLDRYRLVSNSDAHSPPNLGREACMFETEVDYFSIFEALKTGQGYVGTVEFYPEEGKYHLDGHRKCGVCLTPAETKRQKGLCPVCGKPVTVGVMHRVEELADRLQPMAPSTAGEVRSLVPLAEILSEITKVGTKSKSVVRGYEGLLSRLGPELFILDRMPIEEIERGATPIVAEAIERLRLGRVIRQAGYDGEYGVIRLFEEEELEHRARGIPMFEPSPESAREPSYRWDLDQTGADALGTLTPSCQEEQGSAAIPEMPPRSTPQASPHATGPLDVGSMGSCEDTTSPSLGILSSLDPEQRAAAEIREGPLLILAGPGSGKTRTLTHRIAHLCAECGVEPRGCLAITFTRRAADEMRERWERLVPKFSREIPVFTFHGFGLSVLQEYRDLVGLSEGFGIVDEFQQIALLGEVLQISQAKARRLSREISKVKRSSSQPGSDEISAVRITYDRELRARNLVDYDDLVGLAADILESDFERLAEYRRRYPWISIDEYQDVDQQQYRFVRLLAPCDGNICVIGDPDQAIYGFRGADVRFFHRFKEDYPAAREVHLTRNYRSSRTIVEASLQVVSQTDQQKRPIRALLDSPVRIVIHEAPSAAAEAEFVVHTIERLIGGHTFFSLDSGRLDTGEGEEPTHHDYTFADFAVLYRTEAQAGCLCEAFERSGMPFQKRNHGFLAEHPGVRVLTHRLAITPSDEDLNVRVEKAADALLEQSQREVEGVAAVDIETAVEILSPIARQYGGDFHRFLAALSLQNQADTFDPRAERVALLTLHAAKGLEFRVVFIVGCERGVVPLIWSETEPTALEEERRLFYVGMTRAKDRLFLCRAQKRVFRGSLRQTEPSPYLQDIEEQLLRRSAAVPGRKRSNPDDPQLTLF